ncbi:hypothetical protein Ana3638_22630 [Anaerocolumna sedimenticola]|uniref:Acyltransferase 3 domain-containing protein n=1 Tax=Anaerocolumna sedimenticola TaxID=2696063 RepID=A0A6P1TUW5_9FIRM|nr:acyltransferase [Anaerocolumna sedimenticola]QHQ63225.1 hypothetical protein Ana3638_22630 [Anaerocolumna sedimenticola]
MEIEKDEGKSSRLIWLDFFKGILVFIMVLAHCIQFFGDENKILQGGISKFANLTTFSGFFFVFGATNTVTCFRKPVKQAIIKIVKSFWRYLFAYYISAFAFSIFVEDSFLLPQTIWNIITLRKIMGYSEFLLAFAVMQLFVFLFLPFWRHMLQGHFLLLGVFSLVCAVLPYQQSKEPIVALFIGSGNIYSFPIFPYLIYFIAGICYINYVRNFAGKMKSVIGVSTLILSIPSVLYIIKHHDLPERFPPGLLFILGSAAIIMIYILICERMEKLSYSSHIWSRVLLPLQVIGENSLLFLLLSNLVIFSLKGTAFYSQSIRFVITIFIIILYLCFFMIKITNNKIFMKVKAERNPLIS